MGISSFEKCLKIIQILKIQKKEEITKSELAQLLGQYVGCSKYHNTIKNYINYFEVYKLLIKTAPNIYKIDYIQFEKLKSERDLMTNSLNGIE